MNTNSSNIPDLDTIRKWIDDYAKRVANIQDEKGRGVELLLLRDAIQDGLLFYRSRGAFVDPEETKLNNFDALLDKNAASFLKIVGRKTLKTERNKISPSQERWWWWLDTKVEKRRHQRIKRTITTTGVVAIVLIVLYFAVFRLPPAEQNYLDALTQAEKLVSENNVEEALENLERAIDIFPDRPTPYIMAGCIKEMVGETEEAQRFFTQAKTLYSSEVDFLVEKSNWYFRLNLLEKAYSSIMEALQKDPENLAALNLLGSIYEAENKIPEALEVYNKVLELAEKQGVETMIPIARMKIGLLQLKLPLLTLPSSQKGNNSYFFRSTVLVAIKSTPSPHKFFTIISPLF